MFWKKIKELQNKEENNTEIINHLITRINYLEERLKRAERIIKYGRNGKCTYNMVSVGNFEFRYRGTPLEYINTLNIYDNGEEYSIELPELSEYRLKNEDVLEYCEGEKTGLIYVTIWLGDNLMHLFAIDYKTGKYVYAKTAAENKEGETK